MDPERAFAALTRQPLPVLPLGALIELLGREGARPDPTRLVQALRSRPDLFRVLQWGSRQESTRRFREASGLEPLRPMEEPWVVSRKPGSAGRGAAPHHPRRILEESVRHLSLRVDDGSLAALLRWARVVQETRSLSELLREKDRSTTGPPRPPP